MIQFPNSFVPLLFWIAFVFHRRRSRVFRWAMVDAVHTVIDFFVRTKSLLVVIGRLAIEHIMRF